MAKGRKGLSKCPSEDCRAGNPRQRALMEGERKRLPQESWVARANYCTYCGCVYSRELTGATIHGHLNNEWHPRI